MQFKLILYVIGILFLPLSIHASEKGENLDLSLLKDIKKCRAVQYVLERIECYDSISIGQETGAQNSNSPKGEAWTRANQQEAKRETNTTHFILTEHGDTNPTILLTTPALGHRSNRPILMFSCIDNITRLQVALPAPINKRNSISVILTTENSTFSTQWFVREDYFLLESSRGLDGIKEIQKLFNADTLKIQAKHKEFSDLIFNIKELANEIKPLRTACHW